ncbi:MAG: hypothetical protein IJ673_03925, partial [Treponema sp.]|nr:hypothetical protein [Treponema sp.]
SCSDDEDDDKNGTAYATLPESVGENPLKGKTWQRTSENRAYKWSFSDTTATYTTESKTDYTEIETYKYSYDANQNLLYLAFQSESWTEDGETTSWSSVEEYEELIKKEAEEYGESLSDVDLEIELEYCKQVFSTREVKKYTIGEDDSLKLEDYFDGNLPTKCSFYKDFGESELPSEYTSGSILLDQIRLEDSDRTDYRYYYDLSFNSKAKTFSGKLYSQTSAVEEEWSDITKLGTVTGTYTTEGIGTSGCKVTLTFTALPDGVPVIKTDTAYVLEMDSDSDTYTLVN